MEALMQYVWQHRLWPQRRMSTVDGRQVTVIDPGRLNRSSGPDFFNAKIKIGSQMWAGDVEIHVRASDWHRHGHDGDAAYDSVILHVVGRDDVPIRRRNGEIIPQMLMDCSTAIHEQYMSLTGRSDLDMPCADTVRAMQPLYVADWLTTLLMERLYEKSDRIEALLKRTAGDWESACYVTVARALGFGLNAEPMERLALSLPLNLLFKHTDSPLAVEALFFGMSGLLDQAPADEPYVAQLRSEFGFLSKKFGLRPSGALGWKTGGMRPASSPHRRIATLAAMVFSGFRIMGDLTSVATEEDAARLFDITLSGFWQSHYTFNHANTCPPPRALSRASVSILIINVVAPMIMAYGLARGDEEAPSRAVELLEQLRPENNYIVSMAGRAGIIARSAADSQALIQLRRGYCEQRKCLYCRFGRRMLSEAAAR